MLQRIALPLVLFAGLVAGCSEQKAVIPTGDFTEEQKRAIKAEDEKIADEESHGAKKR
jgi:hypothetical protein